MGFQEEHIGDSILRLATSTSLSLTLDDLEIHLEILKPPGSSFRDANRANTPSGGDGELSFLWPWNPAIVNRLFLCLQGNHMRDMNRANTLLVASSACYFVL